MSMPSVASLGDTPPPPHLDAVPTPEPVPAPAPSPSTLPESHKPPTGPQEPQSEPQEAEQEPANAPSTGISPLDDAFAYESEHRGSLPDPRLLATNLARCVIEILAGARELEQIARWVSDEVYRHLLKRVVLAARARSARGAAAATRPTFSVGSVHVSEPSDGVVEAVVVMHGRVRSRAVALRLEGLERRRWRATAVHVL
jgi:hypothetical protein